MYRNGIGLSDRGLRTQGHPVRGNTAALHWNARGNRCDKEGRPPIRRERHGQGPRSNKGAGERYAA